MADLNASGVDGWSPQGAVAELGVEASWIRLAAHHRGRLGVSEGDVPGIYPVDYVIRDRAILFRTAEGEKLRRIRNNELVVFEVDGEIERSAWSVVVTGIARELVHHDEVPDDAAASLPPWAPTEPYAFVRIEPTAIRGRQWEPPHAIERD
jgi:nitroimidazol reductase NimA-like FMN-containing flavoprotein (pyridoxamine 5'-phosphate oxidase superfamily)